MNTASLVYTVSKTAQVLGVSERTIYRWIYGNKIKASKIAGRWFIKPSELDAVTTAVSEKELLGDE